MLIVIFFSKLGLVGVRWLIRLMNIWCFFALAVSFACGFTLRKNSHKSQLCSQATFVNVSGGALSGKDRRRRIRKGRDALGSSHARVLTIVARVPCLFVLSVVLQ